MGAMSLSHWLIVFVVLLLVFGPKKLGGIGRSLGDALRGFREGVEDKKEEPKLPPTEKKKDEEA
jgi:sec-independent protein translocase protein TatA